MSFTDQICPLQGCGRELYLPRIGGPTCVCCDEYTGMGCCRDDGSHRHCADCKCDLCNPAPPTPPCSSAQAYATPMLMLKLTIGET